MSPSEFDLRTALRDGEGGDELNVDQLILHARGKAAQRRVRILSTVAVVAVVGGLGVGGGLLISSGGDSSRTSAGGVAEKDSNADSFSSAASPPQARGPAVGAGGALAADAAACPSALPKFTASAKPADASARVFRKPVSAVVVCAYDITATSNKQTAAGRLELRGTSAKRLAKSLETEPARNSYEQYDCDVPVGTKTEARYFSIIGIAADSTRVGLLRANFRHPCFAVVTSGSAGSYQWSPPKDLRRKIFALTPH